MLAHDDSLELQEAIALAISQATAITPQGGASKSFLGRSIQAEPISVARHVGVISYEPTELTVTARAGTPLIELETMLDEHNQMLAFEPPHFAAGATIGGTVAAGVSGPARPYRGAVRDHVLGTRVINGKGQMLRFGGEVMKNVAGFDLSRLLTGSMGTLGLLLDVSLKVLPRAQSNETRCFEVSQAQAIEQMNAWAARALPISGACYHQSILRIRLSGSETAVRTAIERLGGERDTKTTDFWQGLKEHTLDFFRADDGSPGALWRISVPAASETLALPGQSLIDWGGALRWVRCDADTDSVRRVAQSAGGHATLFRGGDRRGDVHHPLDPTLMRLHQRIKLAFDPKGIFSPGRLYPEF